MKSIYSIVSRIFLSAVAILFTYHLALGASPLSNQDAMRLIEESARKDFVYVIPEGEIEIYSVEVEVSVSKQKLPQKKHSYPAQYLNLLGAYAKCGLIEIKEIKEDKSLLKKVLALGTKKYLVTITEKGKKAAVDKSPDGDYILRMGEVKMASIDKNYQFEPPVKDQYDYVYVLGKYKVFPTEIGKEFFYVVREPLQDIYRIKAIFRKDSLQDQYEFVVYDWGFIDKEEWYTNRIPFDPPPPYSDSQILSSIERGRRYMFHVPVGEVKIEGGMGSYFIEKDAAMMGSKEKLKVGKNQYTASAMEYFNAFQKCGIIKVYKKELNATQQLTLMGGQLLTIELTEKGQKLAAGNNKDGDYLFKMGDIRIVKVVKDEEYKWPVEDGFNYKIIMGIYEFYPTQIGKEFYPAYGQNLQKKYKFRAIVKEDPFQEEFAYITSDWGYLDKGTWETRNCEYKR